MKRFYHACLCLVTVILCSGIAHAVDPQLIPQPKSVKPGDGSIALTSKSRIIATDDSLNPLATILSGEIHLACGLQLSTATDDPQAGDIILQKTDNLKGEEPTLPMSGRLPHYCNC
jgi:hypothetical protein